MVWKGRETAYKKENQLGYFTRLSRRPRKKAMVKRKRMRMMNKVISVRKPASEKSKGLGS